ncbi:ABC transporter permease [Candidatus Bipolaricaulota bacterium]|nr:ABC transporter permease [Candidatus Bipolaricaulota bacterium]MCK4598249.1 ABC transporter permease [Candidatus Bipolaricaulota bacterium]
MWENIRLLFFKEITGAIRDRRTLILTVFFPLIFYPLILMVMGRFTAAEQTRLEEMIPTVIVVDKAADETFLRHLRSTQTLYPLFYDDVDQGLLDLKSGIGQVVMSVDKESGGPGIGLNVALYYDQTDQGATIAAARVRDFLEGYLKEVMRDKLDALGFDYDELSPPLSVRVEDVSSGESVGRMILSRLLPYFMVLAILTGAMGLGAEITAGEKERGTIATLLVSQLSRTQIVLGKFLTILTVSLVSSLLSAVGLLIGVRFFGGGLAPVGTVATFSLGLTDLGFMLVVLVPLAVILASLVVIVGSFARSQKEASTYLMPIYMVIILVGLISMTGGVSFVGTRFLIPVANAIYALQEIIEGNLQIFHLLYTLVANTLCGGLLIAASIGLFKREAVLFRS